MGLFYAAERFIHERGGSSWGAPGADGAAGAGSGSADVDYRARPPSTGITAPVIPPLPSPASQASAAATSSGVSSRRTGCWAANADGSGSPYSRALSARIGVSVEPGLTAFAVTPVSPSSAASARLSPATPAVAAQ